MSATRLQLPDDPQALSHVINGHVAREMSRTSYRRLMWLMYHYYLQGARHFQEFNVRTSQLQYNFVDEKGNLFFRSQRLLQIINQFVGNSLSADWRPSVTRTDLSLAGIRERAVAQVILDAIVTPQAMSPFIPDFLFSFWAKGGVGVAGAIVDHPKVGLTCDLQAIDPSELFPFPSIGVDKTKASGLLWRRFLSAEVLKEKIGTRTFNKHKEKMRCLKIATGDSETRYGFYGASEAGGAPTMQGTGYTGNKGVGNIKPDDVMTEMIEVREVWVDGDAGFCDRYVLQSGDAILIDLDKRGKGFYRNVEYFRCLDDGTWHGQGICDLLFPYIREHEKMLSYLLENIRSMSQYDLLVLPQSAFDANTAFRDTGKGLGIVTWNPDPLTENQRPMTVKQVTSGEVPGRAAVMLDGLVSAMSFPEILQGNAPGRVDSTSGLQFLDEQARKSLNAPTGNLQAGLGAIYRAMAAEATGKFADSKRPIPVSRLTLGLAGAVINPSTNTITFDSNKNPLPDPSRLVFTVKNAAPKNPAALKQEAREYLNAQQMTRDEYLYFCVKEGLDAAMPMDRYRNAYEKVVKNVLILFGDGETPGQIVATPYGNMPAIDLLVLEEFMCSTTFQQASPEVQTAFMQYQSDIQTQMGVVLPAGYQNPDDYVVQRSADVSQGTPQ